MENVMIKQIEGILNMKKENAGCCSVKRLNIQGKIMWHVVATPILFLVIGLILNAFLFCLSRTIGLVVNYVPFDCRGCKAALLQRYHCTLYIVNSGLLTELVGLQNEFSS